MTASSAGVFLELAALFVALIPLGVVLLRALERFRGRPFWLTPLERALVAPYLAAAILFVLASLSLPIYGAPLVGTLLLIGAIVAAVLWVREKGTSLRHAGRWLASPVGLAVIGGTLALFAMEVVATGTHPYPNAYDGSFQSLYLQLLLSNHTVAWTLQPYAQAGVIYPQFATVWLSLPILLWGWPIPSAPVALPTLFLALGIPAGFCWGERLGGVGSSRGTAWGLVFATGFGGLLALPRFFIGGSYDFLFGLPLFLLALGWLRPFAEGAGRSWRDVVLFGGLLGVLTALSLSLGEAVVVLLLGYLIVFRAPARLGVGSWAARFVAVLAIACAFVARSIAGVILWYSYPAHTLSATGAPPYAATSGLASPSLATYIGALDPFVPLKPKLSPLPILSVEVAALLAISIVISVVWLLRPRGRWRSRLPAEVVVPLWIGTIAMFLWTAGLVAASGPRSFASVFDTLASAYEGSYLLFLFFQSLALLPLVALTEILRAPGGPGPTSSDRAGPDHRRARVPRVRGSAFPTIAVLGVVLLAAPLAVGVGVSAVQAPGYLSGHLDGLSNVTSGDVAALTWSGGALPACSVVLAAPGSAAQFLPVFARLHVDFPMMPLSVNLSYSVILDNLTDGVYSSGTRSALLSLGVTQVFVTGRTSVSYPALDPAPMEASADFSIEFHDGDAYVFGFGPGIAETGCAPLVPTVAELRVPL